MSRKFFNLNLSINDNNSTNDANGNEKLRDTNSDNDESNKLSLQLVVRSPTKNYQVNSTITSPFQALKQFHERVHNRSDNLHFRTRTALQNAFYK